MLIAQDKDNKRVHIDNTDSKSEYFCPCCGSKMVLRKGNIRIHHFAHSRDGYCKDSWHYDMSEWHYNWQKRFPNEYLEIVKVKDNQKHKADVLIEDKKVVFEFQHSPMSPDEFEKRNQFYNSLSYKVIWVFDVEDEYEEEEIGNYESNKWYWDRPRRTFDNYNYRNKMVELYLQLNNTNPELIIVIWCTDNNGLYRFVTDGRSYKEDYIVSMFDYKQKQKYQNVQIVKVNLKMLFCVKVNLKLYFFAQLKMLFLNVIIKYILIFDSI